MATTINASTTAGLVNTADTSGILQFQTNGTTVAQTDTSSNFGFNSGYGSVATAYGCRAWVNWDGSTGSGNTIRASGNVTSVTRNGTGDYTIAFTNAMPDTNFCVAGNCAWYNAGGVDSGLVLFTFAYATGSIRVYTGIPGTSGQTQVTLVNNTTINVAVFR